MTQKVYVCYVTMGQYSDTEWEIIHVYKEEDKAKEWVRVVEELAREPDGVNLVELQKKAGIPAYHYGGIMGEYIEMELE